MYTAVIIIYPQEFKRNAPPGIVIYRVKNREWVIDCRTTLKVQNGLGKIK